VEREYKDDEHLSEHRAEESVTTTHGSPSEYARDWLRAFGLWAMFGLAVVETLLGFRLGFQLAGANETGFVDFIYDITGPMVEPFTGIGEIREVNGGILEPATIVAMLVYFAAGMLFIALLWALSSFPARGHSRATYREDRTHAYRER
jgi:hypothetical protein